MAIKRVSLISLKLRRKVYIAKRILYWNIKTIPVEKTEKNVLHIWNKNNSHSFKWHKGRPIQFYSGVSEHHFRWKLRCVSHMNIGESPYTFTVKDFHIRSYNQFYNLFLIFITWKLILRSVWRIKNYLFKYQGIFFRFCKYMNWKMMF